MEKDHEEYNIGVLDIYGFEIFQVWQWNTWGLRISDLGEFFCNLEGRKFKSEKKITDPMARIKAKKSQLIFLAIVILLVMSHLINMRYWRHFKEMKSLILKERSEIPQKSVKSAAHLSLTVFLWSLLPP